jgi:hypothetical protein
VKLGKRKRRRGMRASSGEGQVEKGEEMILEEGEGLKVRVMRSYEMWRVGGGMGGEGEGKGKGREVRWRGAADQSCNNGEVTQ